LRHGSLQLLSTLLISMVFIGHLDRLRFFLGPVVQKPFSCAGLVSAPHFSDGRNALIKFHSGPPSPLLCFCSRSANLLKCHEHTPMPICEILCSFVSTSSLADGAYRVPPVSSLLSSWLMNWSCSSTALGVRPGGLRDGVLLPLHWQVFSPLEETKSLELSQVVNFSSLVSCPASIRQRRRDRHGEEIY